MSVGTCISNYDVTFIESWVEMKCAISIRPGASFQIDRKSEKKPKDTIIYQEMKESLLGSSKIDSVDSTRILGLKGHYLAKSTKSEMIQGALAILRNR